ncbi:MAG TPA: KamA family radical SAM protein [Thermoanaerobaculia bacterium]|nr:KamA family radical SAM protein [Thermoanaerobaculia bacterium]
MKREAFASLDSASSRREEVCNVLGVPYDDAQWNDWRWQMRHRLTRIEPFERLLELTESERRGLLLASEKFSVAVTPHFATLIDPADPGCPIRRQVVPVADELAITPEELADPCGEDHSMVVEGLVHRYPDRVLFLVLDTCAAYCRYCTRSRLVSQGELEPLGRRVEAALSYLRAHTEVRDVLISGGDPLLMSDASLDQLLGRLAAIPHLEFLRLGTRIPAFLPQRITPELAAVLRKHRAWLSVHFCHPRELTPEVAAAADILADGGVPMGCQTVLLRGVNDSVETLRDLFHGLLKLRIRPYYLYQCDPVIGTSHLRTSIGEGLNLMAALRGYTTGYAVPTYVVDAPGGGGKIPVQTETITGKEGGAWHLRNWAGETFTYVDPAESHGR